MFPTIPSSNHFDVETPSKLCKVYQRNRWRYKIQCNIGLGNMYQQLEYMSKEINDVPRFLAIFYLPTYLVLLYNV